jgi:hypothetical protein
MANRFEAIVFAWRGGSIPAATDHMWPNDEQNECSLSSAVRQMLSVKAKPWQVAHWHSDCSIPH